MDRNELTPINAVIYTDGSAGPTNPGNYSSGMHGFLYLDANLDKKTSDKPNKQNITNLGYVTDESLAKEPFNYVKPEYYVNGICSFDKIGTNNQGEVEAIIRTIEYATNAVVADKYKITNLVIKTDSTYAIHVFDKTLALRNKEWLAKVEVNLDLWHDMDNIITLALANELVVTVVKVAGHSDSLGNHVADRLAQVGRNRSTRGVKSVDINLSPASKYWKPDKNVSPLMNYRQLFFTNEERHPDSKPFYSILDNKKDDEPGKKSLDASFGIYIPSKRVDILEDVISHYQKHMGSRSVVSTIDLSVLYGQANLANSHLFKEDTYNFNTRTSTLSVMDELPIVYRIQPAGLATQALDRMLLLFNLSNDYLENKETLPGDFIDITAMIYANDGKKNVCTLENGINIMSIDVKLDKEAFTMPLALGKDTLDRNSFKKLEKNKPKVILVLKKITNRCYNYYTIVHDQLNDDLGVYCNYYSDTLVLK